MEGGRLRLFRRLGKLGYRSRMRVKREKSSFGGRSGINLSIIPDQQTVIDDYIAAGWTGFASVNGEFQLGARFTEGDLQYEVIAVNPNEVTVLDIADGSQNQNLHIHRASKIILSAMFELL